MEVGLLLLAGFAVAACGAEAPLLQLGDHTWSVSGGTWSTATAEVQFSDGFAFDVVSEGRVVGVVFAGSARQTTRDPDGSLRAALARELGLNADAEGWTVPVDVAWSTGAAALPGWTALRIDGSGSVSVDRDDMETVMVVSHRELAAARTRAAAALWDRSAALSDSGYPLTSMLAVQAPGWRLLETRTPFPVGSLAASWTGTADPWISTLLDDPSVDGGRRVATVSLGTRYVEAITGT